MRRRGFQLLALVVAAVALGGCQIVTVFDTSEFSPDQQDIPFGYRQVAALPDGGFMAVGCGFEGHFGGTGVVVRPGAAPRKTFPCAQEPGPTLARAPGGVVYSAEFDIFFGDGTNGVFSLDPATLAKSLVYDAGAEFGPEALRLGQLYVTDAGTLYLGADDGSGTWRIVRVTGPATSVAVPGTSGLGYQSFVVRGDEILAVAGDQVVAVDAYGHREVFAGTGVRGFAGDGGPAVDAQLRVPQSLDLFADGAVVIADTGNGRLRRVGHDGLLSTMAGGGSTYNEGGLATDAALVPTDVSVTDAGCVLVAEPRPSGTPPPHGVVRRVGMNCD